ncbi:uncharacterized protein LOC111109836 isoform X1 [Crassostrea virginica]
MDTYLLISITCYVYTYLFYKTVHSQICGQCNGNDSCAFLLCKNGCVPGFFLPRCTQRCGKCAGDGACDQSSGTCNTQKCLSGYFSILCTQKCSSNCGGDGSCHFTTANCLQGCAFGYSGSRCGIKCPTSNCNNPCDALDGGICLSGCRFGRFGETCTQLCNCLYNGTCDQESGECPLVSTVGQRDVIPKSSTRPSLSSSTVADGNDWVSTDESSIRGVPMNHNTTLIAGLSVSFVLVLTLLLVVGLLLWRRFERKRTEVHVYEGPIIPHSEGFVVCYDSLGLPAENDYAEICSICSDTYTKIPENTTKNNIDELKISNLSKLQENTSKSISMD